MAKQSITVDDIDGTQDAKTIEFAFDGDSYEIDLAAHNVNKLHDALAPFIEAARKQPKTKGARPARSRNTESKDVREWAAKNGHDVPARGRIPQSVMDAYNAR
ncbi:Lsr2 family protein [Microbacterium sp. 77mftsu3.1]|uniref:histone-like nucleoid-structuring protein Lsr2 n=1 Tax=Microbacterium sp. 77mftsu3.1 TaxID=1761802 RepID=UPI000380F13F|nr:Lsr2 family protein [Microbacterium sp. 77mftsu3.1]SDH32992.1 Lsr2 protein [Microbacterium sp. 77mftsu3.1]